MDFHVVLVVSIFPCNPIVDLVANAVELSKAHAGFTDDPLGLDVRTLLWVIHHCERYLVYGRSIIQEQSKPLRDLRSSLPADIWSPVEKRYGKPLAIVLRPQLCQIRRGDISYVGMSLSVEARGAHGRSRRPVD
ncbi:unnamed protein product [Toxocara canis]|uniref:DinB_2 domain-containing protein n=1 Tax=Toxocara canis TaxID=6265 RepID=A0A183TUU5_TOXCA|nr:unnamed protein product [Toxocara canis]